MRSAAAMAALFAPGDAELSDGDMLYYSDVMVRICALPAESGAEQRAKKSAARMEKRAAMR